MSKCDIHQTNYLRSNSRKKTYSPESNDDLEESIDDKSVSTIIDDNNIIMKTPQSLDDLFDVDDDNDQNEEDKEETENDDDEDSTRLSIDDSNTTETTRQKKSNKKNGKLQQLVK
jgi:hypothetical protein